MRPWPTLSSSAWELEKTSVFPLPLYLRELKIESQVRLLVGSGAKSE